MKISKLIHTTLNGIGLLLIIVVLTIMMKVFLFASFKIPTPSMAPAIMDGDYILVNKLAMGPRIFENWGFMNGEKTKMKRIRGCSKVKRNDVLVFDFPYKPNASDEIKQGGNLFYVKRCVAIPGDTFYIENGIYKVKGINERIGHVERQRELAGRDVTSFSLELRHTFPKDTVHYPWTIKDFGPLYVPAQGNNIQIDSLSIILYENLIEYETGKAITVENGIVRLCNTELTNYTFQQDYYFMAGDWIFDSVDSRYWGLLPDDLVIGKASLIWKSQDMITNKYRWNRFFKTIK
ncbi:MAG: signal peptidase I [Tannerella sp.]|jgi:signal peptidase I|nr:signal peptidase I [Tannerella sp.]